MASWQRLCTWRSVWRRIVRMQKRLCSKKKKKVDIWRINLTRFYCGSKRSILQLSRKVFHPQISVLILLHQHSWSKHWVYLGVFLRARGVQKRHQAIKDSAKTGKKEAQPGPRKAFPRHSFEPAYAGGLQLSPKTNSHCDRRSEASEWRHRSIKDDPSWGRLQFYTYRLFKCYRVSLKWAF